MFSRMRRAAVPAHLAMMSLACLAQSSPLNDTGIAWSGHGTSGHASTCDAADPAGQDCLHGRDKAAVDGVLAKQGGSALNNGQANGFDFTKISNAGDPLPASAALGPGSGDWACTRDNVTGLVWEVKVDDASHLRHQGHTYTWFDTHSTDGNPGTAATDGGHAAACKTAARCDTEKYVEDVNQAALCGAHDWRLPTIKELGGIVDFGRVEPSIDPDYFPHTPADSSYWSGSPLANNTGQSWMAYFGDGYVHAAIRIGEARVRLVRR